MKKKGGPSWFPDKDEKLSNSHWYGVMESFRFNCLNSLSKIKEWQFNSVGNNNIIPGRKKYNFPYWVIECSVYSSI